MSLNARMLYRALFIFAEQLDVASVTHHLATAESIPAAFLYDGFLSDYLEGRDLERVVRAQ